MSSENSRRKVTFRKQNTSSASLDSSTKATNITPNYLRERFITVLDQLDRCVEKFRKEANTLLKRRDFLLTCLDLLQSDEQLPAMPCVQRDQIFYCNNLINKVFIQVSTIRDSLQEKSLEQVNHQINVMIGMSNPKKSLRRCQMFLNSFVKKQSGKYVGPTDSNFETALFRCTIDDQKEIRNRLEALKGYMTRYNKNTKESF